MDGRRTVCSGNHSLYQEFEQFKRKPKPIYDNHESHLSIAVINLAKANSVTILTIPPHSSSKMQPLFVCLDLFRQLTIQYFRHSNFAGIVDIIILIFFFLILDERKTQA